MDKAQANPSEIRFVGNSLGAQLSVLLAAHFKDNSANKYGPKVRRVAILDHFFSLRSQAKAPGCSCSWWNCWYYCPTSKPADYAKDVLFPKLRVGSNPAVIENYRTSGISQLAILGLIGDPAEELNELTVFTELKPWYYGGIQIAQKHVAGGTIYLHCMKFADQGQLRDGAPSCRMDTNYLRNTYCPGTGYCKKRFKQRGDDGAFTTWDYDDRFDSKTCRWKRYWWSYRWVCE